MGDPFRLHPDFALEIAEVDAPRALVVGVPEPEIAEAIGRALGDHRSDNVVAPSGIPAQWLTALPDTVHVHRDDPVLSHTELDTTSAVVTDATVGIAETGTIVLDHGPGQGRRALSLVPDLHICLVRADQVVSDAPEAVVWSADEEGGRQMESVQASPRQSRRKETPGTDNARKRADILLSTNGRPRPRLG